MDHFDVELDISWANNFFPLTANHLELEENNLFHVGRKQRKFQALGKRGLG